MVWIDRLIALSWFYPDTLFQPYGFIFFVIFNRVAETLRCTSRRKNGLRDNRNTYSSADETRLKWGVPYYFVCFWTLCVCVFFSSSGLCGVRVHKKVDHTIVLDPTTFVNSGINPINIDTHTVIWTDLWQLTKSRISEVCGGSEAVENDTDWIASCGNVWARCNRRFHNQRWDWSKKQTTCVWCQSGTHLTIQPFSQQLKWNDLAVTGYTDAAQGDRVDGSSTGGYVMNSLKVTWPLWASVIGRRTCSSVWPGVHWVSRSSKLAILMMRCLQLVYSEVESTGVKYRRKTSSMLWKQHLESLFATRRECTQQQFDSFGPDWKTKWNLAADNWKTVLEEHDTDLRWCHSDIQLADGMTKKKMSCRILSFLRTPRWNSCWT